jgi:hypothetical protein
MTSFEWITERGHESRDKTLFRRWMVAQRRRVETMGNSLILRLRLELRLPRHQRERGAEMNRLHHRIPQTRIHSMQHPALHLRTLYQGNHL